MTRHSLTDKDPESRTASCSVCGPVEIRPAGAGWVCLNKKRENEAAWRARNPEKVRAGKKKRSPHHLSDIQESLGATFGRCPIDGIVRAQAVPRGWMCSVRAVEMGRSLDFDRRPDDRCLVCNHWSRADNPVRDGRCRYHFVGWEFASQPHTEDGRTDAQLRFEHAVGSDWKQTDEPGGSGYSWVDLGSYEDDARKMPKSGKLKVLGDTEVPPEWEWALDPKADWTSFDEEASREQREAEPQVSMWADGLGQAWGAAEDLIAAADTTLVDLYPKFSDEDETFEEFENRFMAGAHLAGYEMDSPAVRKLLNYDHDEVRI